MEILEIPNTNLQPLWAIDNIKKSNKILTTTNTTNTTTVNIPYFDAKVIAYPTRSKVKDYLSWRQADCHVNNLVRNLFM
jgi:tRNA(His) 5'-end guanylyltransferase